jgi:hypothetical protein
MTYRLDVWYTPPQLAIGKMRRKGSVGALRELEKVQRIAALAINRVLCSTASDTLDVHANLMPVDLMLEKVCHRGLGCVCTLPDTHPLHQLVRDYSDNPAHAVTCTTDTSPQPDQDLQHCTTTHQNFPAPDTATSPS